MPRHGRLFLSLHLLVPRVMALMIVGSGVAEARGAETCLPKTAFQKVFEPVPDPHHAR